MPYVLSMARITVRNLEEWVMQRLRERGSTRGVSMEQEARDVVYASLGMPVSEGFEGRAHPLPGSGIGSDTET